MAIVEASYPNHQQIRSSRLSLNLPLMESGPPVKITRERTQGSSQSAAVTASPQSTPPRPSSALARGVKITECNDSMRVNPDPITNEDSDVLLEDYLSPRKLKDLTGIENLEEVHYLEMKVDTEDTSLGNFGAHLPNISQLKLSNSRIQTVRDLGSSLHNLRVLWMAQCGLEDLDGISSLISLKELYLAYNEISDISPCGMLENLQILDLEGNNIEDISQVEFLALCSNLSHLTLDGNPICITPYPDEASPNYNLRSSVKSAVPHLRYLDDELLEGSPRCPEPSEASLVQDWQLLDQLLKDGTYTDVDDNVDIQDSAMPGFSSGRPATGYRPGSALKPYTASGVRPGTRSKHTMTGRPVTSRPGSSGRPGTGRHGNDGPKANSTDDLTETQDDSSDLTRGGIVCGNPSRALRSRSKQNKQQTSVQTKSKIFSQLTHKPEHSYDTAEEDDNLKDLLSELQEWKIQHQQRMEQIQASKAPQVLKINHDDAVSLSSDESVSSDDDSSESDLELYARANKQDYYTTDIYPSYNKELDTRLGQRETIPEKHSETVPEKHSLRPVIKENRPIRAEERIPSSPNSASDVRDMRERAVHKGKSQSFDSVHSPSPLDLRPEVDLRPYSGPVVNNTGRFRLQPPIDKSQPKVIDKSNPVIRASIHSPENRITSGPRAETSRAALLHPVTQLGKIKKGHLPNVSLLPSKYSK